MATPFTLSLTPAGHVLPRPAAPDEPGPETAAARRIHDAFERGYGAGLLHLGATEARTALPPVFAYWRDLGRAACPEGGRRAGRFHIAAGHHCR